MLFRSRACLPEWSSQSSPGNGGSPTAFPQPRPCCHIWHLTALSAGQCWKMWSGALAHRVICWCGKSWHSSKITRLCCGPDDFLQRPLSAPGLLGVGCFVVSVSFVGSSLSFFFFYGWCVLCVCVYFFWIRFCDRLIFSLESPIRHACSQEQTDPYHVPTVPDMVWINPQAWCTQFRVTHPRCGDPRVTLLVLLWSLFSSVTLASLTRWRDVSTGDSCQAACEPTSGLMCCSKGNGSAWKKCECWSTGRLVHFVVVVFVTLMSVI